MSTRAATRGATRAASRGAVRGVYGGETLAFPTTLLGDVMAVFESGESALNDGFTISAWEESDSAPPVEGVWFGDDNKHLTLLSAGDFPFPAWDDAWGLEFDLFAKATGATQNVVSDLESGGSIKGHYVQVSDTGKIVVVVSASVTIDLLKFETTAAVFDASGSQKNIKISLDGSGTAAGASVEVDGVPVAITTLSDTLNAGSAVSSAPLRLGAWAGGNAWLNGGFVQNFKILNAAGEAVNHWPLDANTTEGYRELVAGDNATPSDTLGGAVQITSGWRKRNVLPFSVEAAIAYDINGKVCPSSNKDAWGVVAYEGPGTDQPWVRAVVFRHRGGVLDALNSQLLDGIGVANRGHIWAVNGSGTYNVFAGTILDSGVGFDDSWHVMLVAFNGATTDVYFDGMMAVEDGDAGLNSPDGLTLFRRYTADIHEIWDGDCAAIVDVANVTNVDKTASDLLNYLVRKYLDTAARDAALAGLAAIFPEDWG